MPKHKHETIITKDTIHKGLESGLITLIKNPQQDTGTVCQIGEYWFYFGGETAEEYGPKLLQYLVPYQDIESEIYDALMQFKENEENKSEYLYYLAMFEESGYTQQKDLTVFIKDMFYMGDGRFCILMNSASFDTDLLYPTSDKDEFLKKTRIGRAYLIDKCMKNYDVICSIGEFTEICPTSNSHIEHISCCKNCIFRHENHCAYDNEAGDLNDRQGNEEIVKDNDLCAKYVPESTILNAFAVECLINRPEIHAIESISYNPDADAGGQFVIADYSYDDIIDAASEYNSIDSFFLYLEMTSEQTLVDKGTKEFNDLANKCLKGEMQSDFEGHNQDTVCKIIEAAALGNDLFYDNETEDESDRCMLKKSRLHDEEEV